jgi:short-subunit dehydrogenase
LVAISECLHHDLAVATGGKVRVSVLCPAWVRTNIADSERNRPAHVGESVPTLSARERRIKERTRATVAAGMPPEQVAEMVLGAIVEERFWVLTHPDTKRAIEARMRGILDETDPDPEALTAL